MTKEEEIVKALEALGYVQTFKDSRESPYSSHLHFIRDGKRVDIELWKIVRKSDEPQKFDLNSL